MLRSLLARIVMTLLTAAVGAAFGSILRARITGKDGGVVAIPASTTAGSTLVALLAGRKAPVVAFGLGALSTAVFGARGGAIFQVPQNRANAVDTSRSQSSS